MSFTATSPLLLLLLGTSSVLAAARWWKAKALRRAHAVKRVVAYDTLSLTKGVVFSAGWWLWPRSAQVDDVQQRIQSTAHHRRSKYLVYGVELFDGTHWLGKGVAPWGGSSIDYSSSNQRRFWYASLDLQDITSFLNRRRVYGLTVQELADVCYMEGAISGDALRRICTLWSGAEVHVLRKPHQHSVPELQAYRGLLHI